MLSRALAPTLVALLLATPGAGEEPLLGTLFTRDEAGTLLPAIALDTQVEIRVTGLVARTQVSQRFRNDSDAWVQGRYVFPLPDMAAVDRSVLTIGERRIEGRIHERGEAVRKYQQAVREGRKAALLEQERPNLFTTRVAHIGPGELVTVSIEYQEALHYDSGAFELRFPMTLTARYIPGAPAPANEQPRVLPAVAGTGWGVATAAVPDAARITPPTLAPGGPTRNRIDITVILDAGFPLDTLASPSHAVDVESDSPTGRTIRLRGAVADRDFVLRWSPERGELPTAAIFSEHHEGDEYVLLLVLPPADDAREARIPRETVFVIDTSGSMGGASIRQARAALELALGQLAPEDAFNVIAFADQPRALFGGSVPASPDAVDRARGFVGGLRAGGGTEMLSALSLALRDPGADGRLRQVVFITDGSIGNERQLLDAIARELGRTRLFMVGIGSAPNAYLLSRAAKLGRGTATTIGSPGEVRERMGALFAKIERPALGDIEVHWNDDVEMWPARIPDLYAGEPVVVTARLQRFAGDVRISGRRAGRPFEVKLPLTSGAGEQGIHKLFGRNAIAHFMEQRSAGMREDKVREHVLALALRHQLISRYTSLLAVDVTPTLPRGAQTARSNVPNEGPAGFDPALVPGVLPATATPAALLIALGLAAFMLSALLGLASARLAK